MSRDIRVHHEYAQFSLPSVLHVHKNASLSVSTGGEAFEFFVEHMGSNASHRALLMHRRKAREEDGPVFMSPEDEAVIIKRERSVFHGLLLLAMSNVSRAGISQGFYTSFTARFSGLSRTGMNLLAQQGFMMKTSAYDNQEKIMYAAALQKIR